MAADRDHDLAQVELRNPAPKEPTVSQHQPDVIPAAPEEGLDGRDSLRLVKIRLALTLVAAALLPIAAVAPIARAVLDDTRAGLNERLSTEAEHAASEIRRELADITEELDGLALSPDIAAALKAEPGNGDGTAGLAQIGTLMNRTSASVSSAAIVDPAGAIHARAGDKEDAFGASPALGVHSFSVLPDAAGHPRALEVAVAVPASDSGAAPLGSIVAVIPIQNLLAWASPDTAKSGATIELTDGEGLLLGRISPSTGIALPGVIGLASNDSESSQDEALLAVPGFNGVRIVASAPLPVTEIPLPAIVALVSLIVLLVFVIWWMGRQILRPAAELEARRARLHDLYSDARDASLRDSLTGLGNHRAFQEAVGRMVDQSRRYGTPFSLVLLDIDEFKRINDTRGHATGDELLAEVGSLIRATIRQADAGFRIGGDEFALLLASTDAGGAEATARRLLNRGLEERRGGRYSGAISFSAGVTACPEFGTTRMELTAQADAALYRGKRSGRTLVSVFDAKLDRGTVDEGMRSELSAGISAVIEGGMLSPVYQPILHLQTGRILGYEGLVRVAPEAGFAHTGALFDAAEVAGRVLDLDRAALDAVLRGAHRIPPEMVISVNVSPRSFEAPEFNATVFLSILRRHAMAPDRVLLELTERDAIRDPDRLRTAILQLQEAGVRVAADDVGAGNAGLRLLSQFRFDVVKIDLSLVQGGASQDQTLSVLTTLAQLARRWGALTIAEGVETDAQMRQIRQLGIDAGQGYLLGRPGAVLDAVEVDLDELDGGARPLAQPTPVAAVIAPVLAPRPAAAVAGAGAAGAAPIAAKTPYAAPGAGPAGQNAASIIATRNAAGNPFAPH